MVNLANYDIESHIYRYVIFSPKTKHYHAFDLNTSDLNEYLTNYVNGYEQHFPQNSYFLLIKYNNHEEIVTRYEVLKTSRINEVNKPERSLRA